MHSLKRGLARGVVQALLLLTVSCTVFVTDSGGQAKRDAQQTVARIAFGSCARQDQPQPIWEAINDTKPDLFLFIGDNVYGDTEDMVVMKSKYDQLAAISGFAKLRKNVPILATWDDHDFGLNDGGANYGQRAASQKVLLDFFGEPADSPRRRQEGIYDAKIYGPAGKRVQIILLDTRYHRSSLKTVPRGTRGEGRYTTDDDPNKTMLGPAQWQWLEEQLRQPAELRIIASSIQVIAEDHGWEKWMNFAPERQRLFKLIRATKATGVLFVSGDRHLAELSMMDGGVGYPLYDLTASGMNNASKTWRRYEENRHRVATLNWGDNFGLITIDWDKADPLIALQIRDVAGDIRIQQKLPLSLLQLKTIK
jgi:alkaline phosphatase D